MFRANIRVMEEAVMEMRWQIRGLELAISDAECIMNKLRRMCGMEAVVHGIRKEIAGMETQKLQLSRMSVGLEWIVECYGVCEERIMDYSLQ